MKMTMDGKSRKRNLRMCKKLTNNSSRRFNNSNRSLDLRLYRVFLIQKLKERIKMFTLLSLNLSQRKNLSKSRHFLHRYKLKVMNNNGQARNGLKNGKKHCSCQILRHAFHTPTIKQCLSEIN
jgi:hypothetical protein